MVGSFNSSLLFTVNMSRHLESHVSNRFGKIFTHFDLINKYHSFSLTGIQNLKQDWKSMVHTTATENSQT